MRDYTIMSTDHILQSIIRTELKGELKWFQREYNSTTGIVDWYNLAQEKEGPPVPTPVHPALATELEANYLIADKEDDRD